MGLETFKPEGMDETLEQIAIEFIELGYGPEKFNSNDVEEMKTFRDIYLKKYLEIQKRNLEDQEIKLAA